MTDAFTRDAGAWGIDWPFLRVSPHVDYNVLFKLIERWFPDADARRNVPRTIEVKEAICWGVLGEPRLIGPIEESIDTVRTIERLSESARCGAWQLSIKHR